MKYQMLKQVGLKGWAEAFAVRTDLNNHVQLGWKGAGAPAGSTLAFFTFTKDEKGFAKKAEQVAVLTATSDHSITQKGEDVPAEWTKLVGQKLIVEVVEVGSSGDGELPIA